MNEEAFLFGPESSLVGIVTGPQPPFVAKDYPAVILLNAGVVHHVGPNRLYVQVARQLAAAGFAVLRFDLSGIGDSRTRSHTASFGKIVLEETQAAMDLLTRERGARNFILMGICSGADNSLRVAGCDARVIGAVLIDVYASPTAGFYFRSYTRRLLRLRSWSRLARGKSNLRAVVRNIAWRLPVWQSNGQGKVAVQYWQQITEQSIVSDLRALAERDVDVCLIYSADSPAYYNYRAWLKGKFPDILFSGKLQVHLVRDSDHIFTLLRHQEMFLRIIYEWIQKFGEGRNLAAEHLR